MENSTGTFLGYIQEWNIPRQIFQIYTICAKIQRYILIQPNYELNMRSIFPIQRYLISHMIALIHRNACYCVDEPHVYLLHFLFPAHRSAASYTYTHTNIDDKSSTSQCWDVQILKWNNNMYNIKQCNP